MGIIVATESGKDTFGLYDDADSKERAILTKFGMNMKGFFLMMIHKQLHVVHACSHNARMQDFSSMITKMYNFFFIYSKLFEKNICIPIESMGDENIFCRQIRKVGDGNLFRV